MEAWKHEHFVHCLKCALPMEGIMDSEIRDTCYECGGRSKTGDTPERIAARERVERRYAGRGRVGT